MPSESPSGLDRRELLRRMAIGGAAVWAAPIMHSVASAAASSSSCGPGGNGVLNWDLFPVDTAFTSTTIGTITVTMTISNVTNTTLFPTNGRVRPGPMGNVFQNNLRFEMTPDNDGENNGSRQTVTFTFSVPVSNVQFTFFDIDNVSNVWGDRIVMNTGGYTSSSATGNVIGNGTNGNRFRNNLSNNNLSNTDIRGNLTITYPNSLSTFSFTYRNQGEEGGDNQLIAMSDMTFRC